MTVRVAEDGDVDDVLTLIRAIPALPQWGREALATEQSEAEGLGRRPVRKLFIGEDQGRFIGFAQIGVCLGEAELESMAVEPACRGRGWGRLLLQRAIDAARAEGATIFRLEVRRSNEAALHLYRAAGMTVAGTRRGYYSNPIEDAFVLQCACTNGG